MLHGVVRAVTRAYPRRSVVFGNRPERALLADLQLALGAERARAEPLELALYGRDAGVERGEAAAVCFPVDAEQVAAAVAARHDRAFVARGSGTGLAGGATPVGRPVVIVTTRLNRVLEVDGAARPASRSAIRRS